jgi:hypothetical protein
MLEQALALSLLQKPFIEWVAPLGSTPSMAKAAPFGLN